MELRGQLPQILLTLRCSSAYTHLQGEVQRLTLGWHVIGYIVACLLVKRGHWISCHNIVYVVVVPQTESHSQDI